MQLEKEVKQLKKENSKLKEQIKKLNDYIYIIDEALDVILSKHGLTVRNITITDLYELTVHNQSSKNTVRYYYKNEYLLSAPEEMKEELQLKFNELMNLRPKLSINEVKQELKKYKEDVTEEHFSFKDNALIKYYELEGAVNNG